MGFQSLRKETQIIVLRAPTGDPLRNENPPRPSRAAPARVSHSLSPEGYRPVSVAHFTGIRYALQCD